MAEPEATPAELDEIVMDTDDQDAVSEAFERGCAQMRATLNRTKARVLSGLGWATQPGLGHGPRGLGWAHKQGK